MASSSPTDASGPPGGTVEDLLVARLRQLGVRRTYGLAMRGLDHVPVEDPDLAVLLADADGRIGHDDGSGRLGAATLDGPILHLSSAPGGRTPLRTVGSVEDLVDALADPPGMDLPGTLALHLDLDLHAPMPTVPVLAPEPARVPVLVLDPSLHGLRILVLAGPGVVRTSSHAALRSLMHAAGAPVLATFGAVGLLRWDNPYHAGVGGLQALDLSLGGLDDADLVIATGLDDAEVVPGRLAGLVVQEVPPRQLGAFCAGWTSRTGPPTDRPSVRGALSEVLTRLWETTTAPFPAARAALHLTGALPDRGVVVADPGPAGFWVARGAPTSIPGAVCVPATVESGFAAAAAFVAALDGRAVLAVTDPTGAAADQTLGVVDLARRLDVPLGLQVWGAEGPTRDAPAHLRLLEELLDGRNGDGGRVRVEPVPVDLEVPDDLIDLAGPVTAWTAAGSGTAAAALDGPFDGE